MDAPANLRRQAGFNMVEVMVVVAILAILAAVAAPNMTNMIRVQRLKTATFDMMASLTFARSEAIKRNTVVRLVPTNAGNWVFGWQVLDASDRLLRSEAGWAAGTETPTFNITGPALVRFNSAGRLVAGADAGDFALTSYAVDATRHRCVSVELSGRAVAREGTC